MNSSHKKSMKNQVNQLQSAIDDLRDNISADRYHKSQGYSPEVI